MDEKILLKIPEVRFVIYFILGYVGVAMTDLLNYVFDPFLLIPHTPINIVFPILGGLGLSIIFSLEDKMHLIYPSPDGEKT